VALWLLVPGLAMLFGAVVLFFFFFTAVPLPSEVGEEPTVLLDHQGEEIAELTPEVGRKDVPLASLPPHVRQSVLAAEDAQFYEHAGVSLPGIFRAAFKNLIRREVTQGGSTISQQYIKNVTDQQQQTALRKIREAALAVKLEQQFSKDEILEFYLNTIYFGRGAYGIEAAALAYFGQPAANLDQAQAAQLAGIIPAPSALDPHENPEGAHRRYRYVLDRLVANNWLNAAEARRLADAPPAVSQAAEVRVRTAPFFVQLVKRELERKLGANQVYRGLRVTTTLDLGMQNSAQRHFDRTLSELDEGTGAMISMDPTTGGVRALVSGRPGEQINLAVDSARQAGSTFKPFALAAWIEDGKSPESTFEAPAEKAFGDYTIHNYGDRGYERMTLREATWKSVNTVYGQVAQAVGPDRVIDMAQRAGIDRNLPEDLSVVLGTGEVSPLELTTAFNTFAAGGVRREAFVVERVERAGKTLFNARPGDDRAFSEQVAHTISDVLRGVIQSGTGQAAAIGRPAAGKTGTTQNSADAWFAGYTPNLTTVVWYGQRDGNSGLASKPTGGGVPARLWGRYMREAVRGLPAEDFPEPGGSLDVVGEEIEPTESETATVPACPEGQIPVVAEDDGGEVDPLQQVCAPSPPATPSETPSQTQSPSESASPTPTESGSPTAEPTDVPTEPEPVSTAGEAVEPTEEPTRRRGG